MQLLSNLMVLSCSQDRASTPLVKTNCFVVTRILGAGMAPGGGGGAAPSVSLSASSTSAVAGDSVALTATVPPPGSGAAPDRVSDIQR